MLLEKTTFDGRRFQFALFLSGGMLIAAGLFHAVLFLVQSGSWEGPLSLRKPILFGLSTGATLLSIGWIHGKLPLGRWHSLIGFGLSVSLVVEVGLITMQQWRGVASHFNHETPFDSSVELWMNILIVVATLILLEYTRMCFVRIDAPKDQQLAIRAGMLFLLVSCVIGFVILLHGNAQVAVGNDPSIVGKAGVAKFPHGIAIHAIQFFPIFAWLLQAAGIRLAGRMRLIWLAIASMTAFTLFSIFQTATGRARFDVDIIGLILLLLAVVPTLPIAAAMINHVSQRLSAHRETE